MLLQPKMLRMKKQAKHPTNNLAQEDLRQEGILHNNNGQLLTARCCLLLAYSRLSFHDLNISLKVPSEPSIADAS